MIDILPRPTANDTKFFIENAIFKNTPTTQKQFLQKLRTA